MSQLYRLDLKVGSKWVPATAEPMSEQKLEKLKRAYAIDRPHVKTRTVPVANGNGWRQSEKQKRGRR